MTLQVPERDIVLRARGVVANTNKKTLLQAGRHTLAVVAQGKTVRPEYHDRSAWLRESDDHATYDSLHSWWIGLPGWARTHVRAMILAESYLTYLWATNSVGWFGMSLFYATTVVYAIMGLGLAYQLIPHMRHHRVYVKPLHAILCQILPDIEDLPRYKVLHVPRNFMDDESPGLKVYLPPADPLEGMTRKKIMNAISSKTGLPADDLTTSWNLVGPKPHLVVKPRPHPPAQVNWADVRDRALQQLTDTKAMIGLGRGDQLLCIDFENDSPHLAISGGSGSGKSVFIKAILAQMVHRGADAIILDVKRLSHSWANGLPGIKYLKDVADIHEELLSVVNEMETRNYACDRGESPGRRLFIVVEELNALKLQLSLYHQMMGGRGQSEAVQALIQLLCMGRQVGIHVIAAAQSFTARSIGGPEARENFGLRALSRYTPQMWNMLCGDVKPMPKKSSIRGRWQVVWAGEAHEAQVIYMTDEEAQELVRATAAPGRVYGTAEATSVRPNLRVINTDEPEIVVDDTDNPVHATDGGIHLYRDTDDTDNDRRTLVTLRDALDQLPGEKLTLAVLRIARARDESFPQARSKNGLADLFDIDELTRWKISKDVRTQR